MKKKYIVFITIGAILAPALSAGFIFMCFWCTCHTLPSTRKEIYNYYSNAEFVNAYGTIEELNGNYISVELDREWVNTLSESEKRAYGIYNDNLNLTYIFPPKSVAILQNNGLWAILSLDENGNISDKTTFTFIIDNSIWWDGGRPFAVGLATDDTVYLDFDTGKSNLLDYVQNEMP